MRRSSACALAAASVLLGACGRPSRVVFVDLDAIANKQGMPLAEVNIPAPPPPRQAYTRSVFGFAPKILPDPGSAPQQNVEEMFKAAQAKAQNQLLQSLRELNQRKLAELQAQQAATVSQADPAVNRQINEKIDQRFHAWADERAPVIDELSWLTGFPLPSQPLPSTGPGSLPAYRQDRAKALQQKLKEIDARFKADTDAIYASFRSEQAAERAEARKALEAETADLTRRAETMVTGQIRSAVSKLRFLLSGSAPIVIPGNPAARVTIPAEKAFGGLPPALSDGILEDAGTRKRLLEDQLRIWLAVKEYTLAPDRRGHRDATGEFETWRLQHEVGP